MMTPTVFGKLGRPRQRGLGSAVLAVFVLILAQGCGATPGNSGVFTGLVSDGVSGADPDTSGQNTAGSDAAVAETAATCTSDKQCSGLGLVCDVANKVCVDCLVDSDCAPDLQCKSKTCKPKPKPCATSKDCPGQLCNKQSLVCVDCVTSADCAPAQFCKDSTCVPDVCEQGSVTCTPDNAVHSCAPDGSSEATVPCGSKVCQGGGCVQPKLILEFSPASAQFPWVPPGTSQSQDVQLKNAGTWPLTISAFAPTTAEVFAFQLTAPAGLDTSVHPGKLGWSLSTPLVLQPGETATLTVHFAPTKPTKMVGALKVWGNGSELKSLVLEGNFAAPCMKTSVTNYDFGPTLLGDLKKLEFQVCNCGSAELQVTTLEIVAAETNSSEFSLDLAALYATQQLAAPPPVSSANPWKISVSKCAVVDVRYEPTDLTPDPSKPDKAAISIVSNAYAPAKLTLQGTGASQVCPVAKATVQEGGEVVPQTLLHLMGSKSTAPAGSIKKYLWTVKQPPGSNQPLLPNASFANPTLQANAAGTYTFCLQVWDQNDQPGCAPACETVLVIPNTDIHIELLWNTPADPNQFDTGPAAGADLDLHFAHPLAAELDLDCDGKPDPWFANPWDVFWFNAMPEWGSPSAAVKDNPSLDLDDTDGAGPENLNLNSPEGSVDEPVPYSVGAHYWNDHGYGTSYATVAIYVQGGLVVQFASVKLEPLDLWYVGKLWWPNVLTGGSKPVFEACHQSGLSCPAKKNLMWQAAGTECITPCYSNAAFVGAVGGASKPGWCK